MTKLVLVTMLYFWHPIKALTVSFPKERSAIETAVPRAQIQTLLVRSPFCSEAANIQQH
jgi:hypothetical protein